MKKRNHDVNIFTTSMDSNDSIENVHGINIYRYGTNFKIASANVALKMIYKPLNYDIEIIHSHSPTPYSDIPAYIYSRRKNVPFVMSYQFDGKESGGSFIRNSGVIFYNRFILNKILEHADVIISSTRSFLRESKFIKKYENKSAIIPNGINLEDFEIDYSKEICRDKLNLPLNKKIILFFGSLVEYKGPDVLLKAFKIVQNEYSNVDLIFAGRGEMEELLRELSIKLNIENNVHFSGFVDEKLKPLYYKSADIFCLPSVSLVESFGIVNLEAMACGVPIVASRLGGLQDVVEDGKNGLLAEPGNEKSLAKALIYLLENEDSAKKMGNYGKQRVQDYSWEKIAEKIEKIYEKLL